MKVGIVAVGQIPPEVLTRLCEGLARIYPDTSTKVIEENSPLPLEAFDKRRKQYNSTFILNKLRTCTTGKSGLTPVLGVLDADVYASGLNYVFGEASMLGKVALISLWRLKPEFYGADQDQSLFTLRVLKEAVHEVGHTLGLLHCPRGFCVMHFSNSIFDTDKKQSLLCDQCYMQAALAIANLGKCLDGAAEESGEV